LFQASPPLLFRTTPLRTKRHSHSRQAGACRVVYRYCYVWPQVVSVQPCSPRRRSSPSLRAVLRLPAAAAARACDHPHRQFNDDANINIKYTSDCEMPRRPSSPVCGCRIGVSAIISPHHSGQLHINNSIMHSCSTWKRGFYPRDAMLARVLAVAPCSCLCLCVCLSVCLSQVVFCPK